MRRYNLSLVIVLKKSSVYPVYIIQTGMFILRLITVLYTGVTEVQVISSLVNCTSRTNRQDKGAN